MSEAKPIPTAAYAGADSADAAAGLRALHFFYSNGTGLQMSDVKFQAVHSCGAWTWAQANYCMWCGGPIDLSPEQVAVIDANVHPAHRRGGLEAPRRAFGHVAARQPGEEGAPSAGPLGSFHNPAWAQKGLEPGHPHVVRGEESAGPPPAVKARLTTAPW